MAKIHYQSLGLRAAPAVNTHGGVRVFGQIIRRTQINLFACALWRLRMEARSTRRKPLKLRRYILGLALVAARVQTNYNLREGCLLRCVESASASDLHGRRKQTF